MKELTSFIELFSDESARPNDRFISELHEKFMTRSLSHSSHRRFKFSKKLLILSVISVALLSLILALIFLPKRDMSDPTKDSLIESVVETSKNSIDDVVAEESYSDSSISESANSQQPASIQQQQPDTQIATPATPTQTTPPSSSAPETVTGFSISFWNIAGESVSAPSMPIGPAHYSIASDTINFDWGAGSPHASIQTDGFVARISKETTALNGTYEVTYASDNGLRIHVNETVIYDGWNQTSTAGTAYFTTDPSSPMTSIVIDYYENAGSASLAVAITKQ